MEFTKFAERMLWTALSSAAIILSWVGINIANKVDLMSTSVIELNANMKHIFTLVSENKKTLDQERIILRDHENRIIKLETKRR